jgi:hypothetical protein
MSIYLQKFVDRVRGLESRGAKDLTMSMADAKDLHADITRLLVDLQNLRENTMLKDTGEEVITVKMDGGSFK